MMTLTRGLPASPTETEGDAAGCVLSPPASVEEPANVPLLSIVLLNARYVPRAVGDVASSQLLRKIQRPVAGPWGGIRVPRTPPHIIADYTLWSRPPHSRKARVGRVDKKRDGLDLRLGRYTRGGYATVYLANRARQCRESPKLDLILSNALLRRPKLHSTRSKRLGIVCSILSWRPRSYGWALGARRSGEQCYVSDLTEEDP